MKINLINTLCNLMFLNLIIPLLNPASLLHTPPPFQPPV